MTLPDYIKEVKERLERATPGIWVLKLEDATLIAHAPEDLSKLIRIVEIYQKHIKKTVKSLYKHEQNIDVFFHINWLEDALGQADEIARGEG